MKKIELFLGRFQPFHTGHKRIIDSMTNPVVVLVKGKQSSEDKTRNPLSTEYQEHLIKKANPGVEVSVSPNGFLPGILGYFRKQGREVVKIYAGADRIASYRAAIDQANKKMPDEAHFVVSFQETERFTSATTVREAIRSGDIETFKKLVPRAIWDEWDTLRNLLKKVNESHCILTFQEWLKEEGENTTTTTSNVEIVDKPLIKKPVKRKSQESKDQ